MIRLLGGVCIMCGGALILWTRETENRRREETLCDIISALQRISEEIHHIGTPLPDLLKRAENMCRGDAKSFFCEVSMAAKHAESFSSIWKAAAERLPVSSEERKIISQMTNGFKCNGFNPCKAIVLSYESLKSSKETWEKKRDETAKCERALCLSAAALLVILLV